MPSSNITLGLKKNDALTESDRGAGEQRDRQTGTGRQGDKQGQDAGLLGFH